MSDATGPSRGRRLQRWGRDSLVAGMIASLPIIAVWIVVDKLVLSMDGVFGLLPERWQRMTWTLPWSAEPSKVVETPGLGFALSLLLLVLVGALARGIFGRRVINKMTEAVQALPVLGTVYSAVRQLLEAVFSSQAQNFQRVVMVEFPRKGCWVLGFVTAHVWKGAQQAVGSSLIAVFVPTTPNPTSGFFAMFAEEEVIVLNMTVEEAFKAIMSSGIVQPSDGSEMIGADVGTMTVDVEPVGHG